ncbi:MurR/RpiR family transcriptional regulator [Clostridium sp. AM58-1XD]|uniref:MurR/RpiR family transcriptional regulator n=1 Tax=Clostridium sp. AM58-1XD TaxID=2292307 RepID=UPI000E480B70|nr:MurR/RpiR family transcriptional regulator [Clostridium sp. AM58-1XD]RGY95998.1 MurR/RpiR family transcriptional regulator [Clostridium sp. AM58-1XD]
MRIDQLLNNCYDDFSENEKYVCHYLSRHYRDCCKKNIEEFARDCNVSKTLLVRFAKKLGLSGYSELKARIKIELLEKEQTSDGFLQSIMDSYHKMMDDLMDKDMSGIFEKLYSAERVFVYGSGSSQARAASEMKRMFLPVKDMIHLYGHDLSYGLQKIVTPQDMVFIISLSGESEAVVELGRFLRTGHVPAVSITRLRSNTLASLCEESLYINSIQLPMKYNMEYEITTPYFILIEYLYLSYQNYLVKRSDEENE